MVEDDIITPSRNRPSTSFSRVAKRPISAPTAFCRVACSSVRPVTSWHGGHPSVVSFELTAMGEVTRLRLVHSHLTPGGSYLKVVAPGWPMLLSSLKSLETGEPLEFRASA